MNRNITPLATLLSERRHDAALSFQQLADKTGIAKGQLFKLEQGHVEKVQPLHLEALAGPLDVPLADLYAAAGFELPTELPSLTPYLRAKYIDLPADAHAELVVAFRRIVAKHGQGRAESADGDDETQIIV